MNLHACLLSGNPFTHWIEFVKEKIGKRSIPCTIRTLISFIVKLVAFLRSLPLELLRRHTNNVHPSNLVENITDSQTRAVEAVSKEEDRVQPCLERLQRLEKVCEELSNKPAGIPLEKEKMITESLERIKCVEFDLEKTKRVSILLCLDVIRLDVTNKLMELVSFSCSF